MDKNKAYCYNCSKELIYDEELRKFEYQCDCYKNISRKRILLFCEKCEKHTSRQGTSIDSKCMRCAVILQHKTMAEQDPEGYRKRQAAASIKAQKSMKINGTGIYSQEVRDKIEKSKRENGHYKKLTEASKRWREQNPEKAIEISSLGGKRSAEIRRETFTEEDWKEWTNRSCNSPTANKSPESKRLNSGLKFCEKCGKMTNHINNTCMKCYPSSGTGRTYELAQVFKPNFITKGNVLYFYNKQLNDYVPWTEYKTQFKTSNIDWQLPDGFQIIPTFRSQDSDNWAGVRGAFEQSLIDIGIGWFVYIKFYIAADGQILPLVVGKSGSLLVNSSGSDLSFSTDTDDGPARCFLAEESLDWCKTQISILACNSEQEAYEQECRFAADYNLFES